MKKSALLIGIFILALATPSFAADLKGEMTKDAPGAGDSSLIGRFEGSLILGQQQKAFDELKIPTGPEKDRTLTMSVAPQGKVTRTLYLAPTERATLEVATVYENALKGQGFEVVYRCGKEECGGNFKDLMYGSNERLIANAAYGQPPAPRASLVKGALEYVRDIRYFAAKKATAGGDVWVSVYAAVQTGGSNGDVSTALTGTTQALVEIVEPKASDAKIVTIQAEEIKKGIGTEGRVAFYGVYFDFDKATLKPESEPQLAEMAKFLQANPTLKIYIVGHTDNKGGLDYNQKLSEGRAQAVVTALAQKYAIDLSRMVARGVASLAPMASNVTEEGRAKNRRVEMVEQ